MIHTTLITLDYPPEHGGVARYLGELVRQANGMMNVVVERDHGLEGLGDIIPREFVRRTWPHWWPMVGVCREFGKKSRGLLISHVLPVGTAAWIARVPFVVICHGLDVRLANMNARKRWLFRRVCRGARAVVANSRATALEITRLVPDVTPTVITPGVTAPQEVDREVARRALHLMPDEEVILCVTRLTPRKGVDILLEASEQFADRENVRLVIVGDGPERADLIQRAEHITHQTTFVHDATDQDLANWYAAADIFCLPTRALPYDMEGFGIVYLEAASYGLPVVAAKAGGASEAVEDGVTGVLVPPGDVATLATELRALLNDPLRRRTLGDAGRARALADFRWSDRWEQLQTCIHT